MSHSFKELIALQKARRLAVRIYRLTQNFPPEEKYGLSAQLRRAAVSVVSNIAEGQGRRTVGEFQQFLGIARGSLLEIETQIIIAGDLGFVPESEVESVSKEARDVLGLVVRLSESLRACGASAAE